MPKGEQRGNREAKKPKKEKPKTIAAAPSNEGGIRRRIEEVGQYAGLRAPARPATRRLSPLSARKPRADQAPYREPVSARLT
jgi:hypothetical protein